MTFSYTGFQTLEQDVSAQAFIEVVLQEGLLLEEALVTALGIRKDERSLGFGVEKIKGDELTTVPQANFVNLLSGRAAGVTVLGSAGGNLGGSSRITIRGLRSIIGENQPLFVVDGVPMDNSNFTNISQIKADGSGTVYESQRDYGNAIQDLNPEDIDNISILKVKQLLLCTDLAEPTV
ncbi:MAG: TonB-dependent receptor plug domain-containing protein [Saprospiraceae bacterium]|nr:TonB-dependent receptor plug domain-containing protein [Saprospiraceae bacterium]